MIVNPHLGQPVLTSGDDIIEVDHIVILLHGRGARIDSMLPLAKALYMPGLHFVIPQAGLNRWYPHTAFGPLDANEPDLSFALALIDNLVKDAHDSGFSDRQIIFGGFSQGACLAAEYVARNAQRYGGLFVFSGALIGPPGAPRNDPGAFNDMPVFIGGSDVDPWVSYHLMANTAQTLKRMGARVDFCIYPGMAHTINQDEIDRVRQMLSVPNPLMV